MTNDRLGARIAEVADEVDGQPGFWTFRYADREVMVVTDVNANRMRIMTPVIERERVPEGELEVLLAANFDRALDARYAIAQGYLWSVFLHPLASLSVDDFDSGLAQVTRLADRYGYDYTSSDFVFGGSSDEPQH